ncbi:hypothetical protein FA15DRAFT_702059 [Coprinopsis marcescibilis]|uniref:Uncharacterized protein n=1 Tax=Coprinopsis marcescibilis TaxID=230819 RepID=A0A5C3L343_COPMA|nr:hypothetical protein FA15DRAFT_702059 [Coprinopsis marcescibilis]
MWLMMKLVLESSPQFSKYKLVSKTAPVPTQPPTLVSQSLRLHIVHPELVVVSMCLSQKVRHIYLDCPNEIKCYYQEDVYELCQSIKCSNHPQHWQVHGYRPSECKEPQCEEFIEKSPTMVYHPGCRNCQGLVSKGVALYNRATRTLGDTSTVIDDRTQDMEKGPGLYNRAARAFGGLAATVVNTRANDAHP